MTILPVAADRLPVVIVEAVRFVILPTGADTDPAVNTVLASETILPVAADKLPVVIVCIRHAKQATHSWSSTLNPKPCQLFVSHVAVVGKTRRCHTHLHTCLSMPCNSCLVHLQRVQEPPRFGGQHDA